MKRTDLPKLAWTENDEGKAFLLVNGVGYIKMDIGRLANDTMINHPGNGCTAYNAPKGAMILVAFPFGDLPKVEWSTLWI